MQNSNFLLERRFLIEQNTDEITLNDFLENSDNVGEWTWPIDSEYNGIGTEYVNKKSNKSVKILPIETFFSSNEEIARKQNIPKIFDKPKLNVKSSNGFSNEFGQFISLPKIKNSSVYVIFNTTDGQGVFYIDEKNNLRYFSPQMSDLTGK
jgi:hypothetical protein